MATFLRFLGHGSPEGPPSIIYQHDNTQYMFNCREGTQRLAVEEKVKLSKLKTIFFTRLEWECTGGMPGMLLTLSDAGVQNVNLCGGRNLTHLMASTRSFVYRTNMTVYTSEYQGDSSVSTSLNSMNTYTPTALKVTPVIVSPPSYRYKAAKPSQSSSSSDYSPSDNPYSVPKAAVDPDTSNIEDWEHRKQVLSLMFSNDTNKQQNKDNDAGAHAMNAPCTPRQHPLANTAATDINKPASESSEAIVEIKQKDDQGKPQAIVTPIDEKSNNQPRVPKPDIYSKDLPRTRPCKSAISYICETPKTRGKFNTTKAMELGVPKGPLFGKLQRGETVTLDDGTVVTNMQVCEKPTPGAIFIVVDCPHSYYIDDLISSTAFSDYQTQVDTQKIPKVIIHLLGDDVLDNVKYRQWMNSFSPETEHIISSEQICAQSTLYRSHAISQYKLSKLDPAIFKIPEYNNIPLITFDKYNDLPPKVSALVNNSTYQLQETRKSKIEGLQLNQRLPFDLNRPIDEPKIKTFDENLEIQQVIQKAKEASGQVDLGKPFPGDDVQVVTLGTGSSIPSKYRNVSATLIKIPKFGSVLLDAGEGTFGQMLRYFGRDKITSELENLRCIFVSHLHADHHLGVFQLLTKLKNIPRKNKKPIYIIAPNEYQRWMKEYNDVEHLGKPNTIRFIRCYQTMDGCRSGPTTRAGTYLNELEKLLGLSKITSVEVDHCRYAYGLSLEHQTGWKLVYSGDTRPCNRLVEAGKNATLLIHEATLEDDMKTEAIAKKHSTTGEAVEVGQKMKARYTLLNHFSQRYAKVPTLSEDQYNVCISFDMMSVFVKQIPLLPKYNSAMQLIFKDAEDEEDKDIDGAGKDQPKPGKTSQETTKKKNKKRKLNNGSTDEK